MIANCSQRCGLTSGEFYNAGGRGMSLCVHKPVARASSGKEGSEGDGDTVTVEQHNKGREKGGQG